VRVTSGILLTLAVMFMTGTRTIAAFAPVREVEKPSAKEIEKARGAVQEELQTLNAQRGKVDHIEDAALFRLFPRHLFFSVIFRRYPVAQLPPAPLKGSNIFVVPRAGGKLQRLVAANELETFFRDSLPAVKDADQGKDAARAWLELAQAFVQDGYFKFAVLDEATKAAQANGIKASGKLIVKSGGNGDLTAILTFDKAGKLRQVEQTNKVKASVRPICQATRLLDADPLVRAMAEQDLRVMGRAVKPYLDEQRSRARPELQKAIDRIWQRILEENR